MVENRVKFKIGEIEFEAEGSAEVVERERNFFVSAILPAAVDAIVHTRGVANSAQYFEAIEQPTALLSRENDNAVEDTASPIASFSTSSTDLSRTSLASFLTNYGMLSEQDFILIAAYYDEKKNYATCFSLENVKKYYAEARRAEPANVSMALNQLAKKGLIMDAPNAAQKTPKQYILTNNGIKYVETYQPKEIGTEKPKPSKTRKSKSKQMSIYAELCADDLNLKNYPEVKSQSTFKKQMILLLYIVTVEGKGDSFSTADVQHLMTEILGLPASDGQIKGVFGDNKSWFKVEHDSDNKRGVTRKLLQGAKDFVQTIIDGTAK